MTEERVRDLVRGQLRKHHPGGVTLDVGPDPIRRQGDYWYVSVLPSAEPPKMYEYYEALAEVETTLQETEQILVFLVPLMREQVVATREASVSE